MASILAGVIALFIGIKFAHTLIIMKQERDDERRRP